MKTSIAKLALGLTLVSMSSIAMAGISTTRHNLGSTQTAGNFTTATTEICVFCHTPHGADSSAAVPLWNRHLGTPADYNTYSSLGTTTMDSASAQTGSVSLACLSCHDGTQAMSVMINSPGFGTVGTAGIGAGGTGSFTEFNKMSEPAPAGEMIYLATDLRNDHPVSIQYAGALVVGTGGSARAGLDPDFNSATSATVGGSGVVWYVETGGAGKQKTDLPLYNRTAGDKGTGLTGQPLVECATCHDPHTNTATFLRHPNANAGSATCLTCHVK